MRRICWNDELFEKRISELSEALLSRGYRYRSIQSSFNKIRTISREQTLQKVYREREVKDRVSFVIKYDPRLPDLRGILKRAWGVLVEDPFMKEIFPSPPMVCYQRVQNIGELLIRAKLPCNQARRSTRQEDTGCGFKPCRENNCPVCDLLVDKSKVIKSVVCSFTKKEILIQGRLSCTSTNLIYCITCKRGGRVCPDHPQYIGETGKSLRERLRGHRGSIIQASQENTSAPVGLHFRSSGHSVCDMEIIPVEKNRSDSITRKVRESFYINKFDTVNNGLNIKK